MSFSDGSRTEPLAECNSRHTSTHKHTLTCKQQQQQQQLNMNNNGLLPTGPPNIPLHCNICPKKPDFSDVSHLLTHVQSKGHLSHYYKLKVKASTDAASRKVVDEYDEWYEMWNVQDLMMERMQQKERKKGGAAGARASTSRRPSGGECLSRIRHAISTCQEFTLTKVNFRSELGTFDKPTQHSTAFQPFSWTHSSTARERFRSSIEHSHQDRATVQVHDAAAAVQHGSKRRKSQQVLCTADAELASHAICRDAIAT